MLQTIKRAGIRSRTPTLDLFSSTWVAYCVEDVDVARCMHDKSVANPVIYFKYHDCTGFFIRQLYFIAAKHRAAREAVLDYFAFLENGQHVAGGESVAGAAIQNHGLVLANQI